jgi:hypothetical protein
MTGLGLVLVLVFGFGFGFGFEGFLATFLVADFVGISIL